MIANEYFMDSGPHLPGGGGSEGFDGLEFLGVLLLDLMHGKSVLQVEPELLGGAEILG